MYIHANQLPSLPAADHLKQWRDRYVVLRSNGALDYYKSYEAYAESPTKPRGTFNVTGSGVVFPLSPKIDKSIESEPIIEVVMAKCSYFFWAVSEEERDEWRVALGQVSMATPKATPRKL